MLAATLLAITSPLISADYFPLKPGTEWTYTVAFYRNLASATQVNKVLDPIVLKGETVTPMQVEVAGGASQTAYYAIKNGFVSIMATDASELLPSPIPVMPVDTAKSKSFEFSGAVAFLGGLTPSTTKTKLAGFEKTTVLGEEKTALKVTRDSVLGGGNTAIKIKSTELYVAGMGMVYQRQETLGKDGGWAEYRLAKFKAGAQ